MILRVFSFALITLATTDAALVAYEGFDYTEPATSGTSDNFGTSNTDYGWSVTEWTTTGGTAGHLFGANQSTLNFNGLPAGIGGSVERAATSNRANLYRDLSASSMTALTSASSAWFSVIYKDGSTGDDFVFMLGDTFLGTETTPLLSTAGSGVGFFSENSTLSLVGYDGTGASITDTGAASLSATGGLFMLAIQIEWNAGAGGADVVSLYNITDASAGAPTATTSFEIDLMDANMTTITAWDRPNASNNAQFDEIRVGTSFGGVMGQTSPIPEPSAAVLGALGSLLLLRRRRSAG